MRDSNLSLRLGLCQAPVPCHTTSATVVSNEREIYQEGKVTYMPVYLVMFLTSMYSNSAVFGSLSGCMESDAPAEDESKYIF